MQLSNELKELLNKNNILFELFDEIRLIEGGGTHRICLLEKNTCCPTSKNCYNFFNRNEKCQNCVSKQASVNGKQMVKLEYFNENYYIVIARPLLINHNNYIIEFIANITCQLATGNNNNESNFVTDLINQLQTVSLRDTFSGLYNKNHMIEIIEEKLLLNKPCYLALLDVDDFKRINDTYGHSLGDEVILKIAKVLSRYCDNNAFRFGGDEFGVIFDDDNYDNCIKIINQIKHDIDNHHYKNNNHSFKVSVSYGITNIQGSANYTDALDKVDNKLYKFKKNKKSH